MRADQGRVDIDHDPVRAGASVPGAPAGPRASGADSVQQPPIRRDRVDEPERRRVGRDEPEQKRLVAHGAQVGKAVAAIGKHDRQIAQHAARIVSAAPLAIGRTEPDVEPVVSVDRDRPQLW